MKAKTVKPTNKAVQNDAKLWRYYQDEFLPAHGHKSITDLVVERDSLREQLRVAQERWISVKERLPELYPDDGGGQISDYVAVIFGGLEGWKRARLTDDGWYIDFATHVITPVSHWMPLPTPPAESTEGKT
jgi:hypothetical protein